MNEQHGKGRVLASLRLRGRRFDDAGMPAESLEEIIALSKLIGELVLLQWGKAHPDGKIPAEVQERVQFRFEGVEEGSAITPLIEPTLEESNQPPIFDPIHEEIQMYTDSAISTVIDFLGAANSGTSVPVELREVSHKAITSIGATLLDGESLQLSKGRALQGSWESMSSYTASLRKQVVQSLSQEYRERATLEGLVESVNLAKRTFRLRDRLTGKSAEVPFGGRHEFQTKLSGHVVENLLWARVHGVLEYSAEGRPKKYINVETLKSKDLSKDFQKLDSELKRISKLESGWLDGEAGVQIGGYAVKFGRKLLDDAAMFGNLPDETFPTEEGGVEFSWQNDPIDLTLEISVDGQKIYLHRANVDTGNYRDSELNVSEQTLQETLQIWLEDYNN